MTRRFAYDDPAVLARAVAILNTEGAAAANGDPSKTEPGTARTENGTPGREALRAA